MELRSRFNLGPRVQTVFVDDGRTKQAMQDECNINKIMEKFVRTGAVEHSNRHAGSYGFATSESFHDSMNIVAKGESMFNELPAAIRSRFNNDVGLFLDFVQSPDNIGEMVDLGLSPPEADLADSSASSAPEPPAGDLPPVAASDEPPPVG